MDSNNKGVERWKDIQVKYEESQNIITKQLGMIDQLNKNINELKEVNNQLEYSWANKYADDTKEKQSQISKLKKQIDETVQEMT
jgi:hypothetical protein